MQGRVINLNGGVYKVILEDGTIKDFKARGKLRAEKVYQSNDKSRSKKKNPTTVKSSPKVGDIVVIDNDMIDHYEPRKNSLIRPDIANVDQIVLVFAAKEPDFSFYLLDLFVINIVKNNVLPVIVITKVDKLSDEEYKNLKENMKYYEALGYKVFYVNNINGDGRDDVLSILKDKITILSGQTGAGKSSLVNTLIPGFSLATQEISDALGRGKHTTRQISLYPFMGGLLGDTPGFSKLEATLLGLKCEELNNLFVEFKNYNCRFSDCNHLENAKDCGIRKAVDEGLILKSRYLSYVKLYNELKK